MCERVREPLCEKDAGQAAVSCGRGLSESALKTMFPRIKIVSIPRHAVMVYDCIHKKLVRNSVE